MLLSLASNPVPLHQQQQQKMVDWVLGLAYTLVSRCILLTFQTQDHRMTTGPTLTMVTVVDTHPAMLLLMMTTQILAPTRGRWSSHTTQRTMRWSDTWVPWTWEHPLVKGITRMIDTPLLLTADLQVSSPITCFLVALADSKGGCGLWGAELARKPHVSIPPK